MWEVLYKSTHSWNFELFILESLFRNPVVISCNLWRWSMHYNWITMWLYFLIALLWSKQSVINADLGLLRTVTLNLGWIYSYKSKYFLLLECTFLRRNPFVRCCNYEEIFCKKCNEVVPPFQSNQIWTSPLIRLIQLLFKSNILISCWFREVGHLSVRCCNITTLMT